MFTGRMFDRLSKLLNVALSERGLPLLLLGCAATSLFVFQNHTIGFDVGHSGWLSSGGLTLAKSLFTEGHLLMFFQRSVQANGQIVYEPYNRFSLFPFLIIGLAIRPFEPNLAWQVYVARQVMNVFFVLSILICFKSLRRLGRDPFLSLALALVVFSAAPLLYYSDMIFNETPTLFGFLLAFYLVVQNQTSDRPTGRLIGFSILALSLGWQPYAVFASWFLVDLFNWVRSRPFTLRHWGAFLKRPAAAALLVASLTGVTILAFQLLNEWTVVGGSLLNLPSVQSIVWRFGLAPAQAYTQVTDSLNWGNYFRAQVRNALVMMIPFTAVFPVDLTSTWCLGSTTLATGLLLAGKIVRWKDRPLRNYPVLMIFVLSLILWAVVMRNFVAFHNFQSMYYLGISITLFTLLSSYLNPAAARFAAIGLCVLFILNVRNMNQIKEFGAGNVNEITQEFQAIYDRLPDQSTVFIDGDRHQLGIGYHAVNFYLIHTYTASPATAEYVISANPLYNQAPLTNNPHINLFVNSSAPSSP